MARLSGAAAAAPATVVDEVDLFLAAAVGTDTRVGTTSFFSCIVGGATNSFVGFFLLRGTPKVGGVGFKLASAARRKLVGRETRSA